MKYQLPTADTGSGLLVPTYAELSTQAAPPTAPAAGKTRLYVDANGLLQLVPAGTAPTRRLVAHWGSGTAFPAGAAVGDTYVRTDIGTGGSLWTYNGTNGVGGWVHKGPIVCTSTTAPGPLYAGAERFDTDTGWSLRSDGTKWIKTPGVPSLLATGADAAISSAIGTGEQAVTTWPIPAGTAGTLQLKWSGSWVTSVASGAACNSRLYLNPSGQSVVNGSSVLVPGAFDRGHNNSTVSPVRMVSLGRMAWDGTAKTVLLTLAPEAQAVNVLTSNLTGHLL